MEFISDILIPGIIYIVFGFILLRAFKKPLVELYEWIRGMFSSGTTQSEYGGTTLYYE